MLKTDYKKRYQQQHEQESVVKWGLIIHQSPPACWVKTSRTTQDTVNQEDTQSHPQRAQAIHRTATPPIPKAQPHTETNPHQPKAWQTMDEHHKLTCHTLDGRKPIPTHKHTHPAQAVQPLPKPTRPPQCPPRMPPKAPPYLPCTSTPRAAHWQEDQNEGTPSLTIYKYLCYV